MRTRRLARSLTRPVLSGATLCGLLLTAACGGDSTGPGRGGFSATVTGATNGSLSGIASFGSDAASGDFLLELYAGETDPVTVVRFRSPAGARPDVGSYAIAAAPDSAGFSALFHQESGFQTTGDLEAQGGTLTVEKSDTGELSGSFQFRAVGVLLVGGSTLTNAEIDVSGSFDAVAGG